MNLLATDLDGTLLNSNHQISYENLSALQYAQEKGCELAIATGRTYSNARAICEKANIKAHIVCNNGSSVYLKSGQRLNSVSFGQNSVQNALQWLDNKQYYYEISTDTLTYIPSNLKGILETDFTNAKKNNPALPEKHLQDLIDLILSQDGVAIFNTLDEIFNNTVDYCKILSVSFDQTKLAKGKDFFSRSKDLSLITSHIYNFELVDRNASKGLALEQLATHLNIPLANVIAVGDNHNDLSMFEKAGTSVAMGNAEEYIKQRCHHVALANDQHGVAHIIHKLIK